MSGIGSEETIQTRRQRLSGIPRACEACSVRKVRCDRATPCANCVAYGITCQVPSSASKTGAKSDKTSQLEERVEALESRLRNVENQLMHQNTPVESVVVKQGNTASQPRSATNFYEGESSFSTQLLTASQVAQSTIPGESGLNTSFDSLRSLVQSSNLPDDHRFSRNDVPHDASSVISPPYSLVAAVLRRIKERTPIFCYGYFLINISKIEYLCQKVYSGDNPKPPGRIASVHGILYFILKELIATSDPLCQEQDLKRHLESCQQSFKASIETYELLTVPCFENILALNFGALKAQEDAKPSLFCTFVSAAASHCRTLGYHRQKTYKKGRDAGTEDERRAFWSVYVFDKTLSLLLGRASVLQDLDIDTQYPEISVDLARKPWDENFIMAIRMARLQGQIYDQLYSPFALGASAEQRARNKNELASIMASWRDQHMQIDASQAAYAEVWRISRQHWDVIYYSTLTSLLRAPISSGAGAEISSQCFHSARLSLQSHMSCFSVWDKSGLLSGKDYANWILHYSSFTAFIVIFLHAISAASSADVQLLDDVVRTLDGVRESSKYSERLYKVCAILAGLAKQLLGSQNAFVTAYQPQNDMLHFTDRTNLSPAFEPQTIQGSLGIDMTDYMNDWEAYDMEAILENWSNGESTTLDMCWDN